MGGFIFFMAHQMTLSVVPIQKKDVHIKFGVTKTSKGVIFVFIDMTRYIYYQFVYSMYRGEIQNFDWPGLLELNPQHPKF